MKKPIIVLDPGHGAHDPGAIGPSLDGNPPLKESDIALDISLRLAPLLLDSFNVHATRTTDTFLTLSKRAAFANALGADLFLSIHCNSADSSTASGFELWTSRGQTASDRAATHLYQAHLDAFPARKARNDYIDGDPDKEADYAVLVQTSMPAVLAEVEFIHTPDGARYLANPANRQAIALALSDGLHSHFGLDDAPTGDQIPAEPQAPCQRLELLTAAQRHANALLDILRDLRSLP